MVSSNISVAMSINVLLAFMFTPCILNMLNTNLECFLIQL